MNTSLFYGTRRRVHARILTNHDSSSESNDLSDDSAEEYVGGSNSSSTSEEDSDDENDNTLTADTELENNTEQENDAATVEASEWGQVTEQQRDYPFTGKEELLVQPTSTGSQGSVTPLDVFALSLTEDIVSDIVTETNRFASQVFDRRQATRSSRLRQWTPTNSEEIKKILGIVIVMGLVRKPILELYWSKKGYL